MTNKFEEFKKETYCFLTQKQHDFLVNELGFKKVKTRCPVCYTISLVRENCIPKQKVREAIEKIGKEIPDKTKTDMDKYFGRGILSALLKELNLEEK